MAPIAKTVGLLLAGGRSRRLGRDKRFLKRGGKPLIAWAYEALRGATDEVWVLLASPQDELRVREALPSPSPYPQVALDPEPRAGPLGALAGALERVRGEYALLLAVDYPLMTAAFLRRLRAHLEDQPKKPDALVPLWQGAPQVTCAFYRRSLHKELQEALASGERSLRRFVEALSPPSRVLWIEEECWRDWTDAPGFPSPFQGVDTPEDLARLRAVGLLCE